MRCEWNVIDYHRNSNKDDRGYGFFREDRRLVISEENEAKAERVRRELERIRLKTALLEIIESTGEVYKEDRFNCSILVSQLASVVVQLCINFVKRMSKCIFVVRWNNVCAKCAASLGCSTADTEWLKAEEL